MNRLVVVGGGIVGTMHGWLAHRAGWSVVQLERDEAARSASVRNFGLIWVSGRADGEELAAALRARDLWESIGTTVPGIGFRPDGSLTVALSPGDAAVMESFAATTTAEERSIQFVATPRDVNPAIEGAVFGGLWCESDAIVEPRLAVGALRSWLAGQERYAFLPGRTATSWDTGRVVDHTGARHDADVVVLCTGADIVGPGLRRVRLQMMQTAPFPSRLSTSIADADSLRYYPAYSLFADDLDPQADIAAANGMQLLLVQRANGELTIGDTHAYEEPFDFAVDEAPYDHLRARAASILGRPVPPTVRRWAGVYSQRVDGRLCHREAVADGVWWVTGLGGRGVTCSPAVAEATLTAAGVL